MSKYKFAKLLGMPYQNIIVYFRPNCDPKLSTISKWAKVLDVSVKELVED